MAQELSKSESFATIAEATDYFNARLNSESWVSDQGLPGDNEAEKLIALQQKQEKSLKWASLVLSRAFIWKGQKTSALQNLAFPRYNIYDEDGYYIASDSIPKQIKDATCELALFLGNAANDAASPLEAGIKDIKVGPIQLKFGKDAILNGKDGNGIPPDIANLVKGFIIGSTAGSEGSIRVVRV